MNLSEAKEKIKEYPISTIVGYYVPLTKKGHNYLALCPFHSDSHPSMHVNDQKGLFMCFACQTGGDAITFVEKFKNLNFINAINDIAGFLNITIEKEPYKEKPVDPKLQFAYKILTKTLKLYRQIAVQKNPEIFQEFLTSRNIDETTAQDFQLGFAPGENALFYYLNSIQNEQERKEALEMAYTLGLVRNDQTDEKLYYDIFRNRIIFPIWDKSGQIVGFGGRAIYEGQRGKYINSFDSLAFNKKNILYAFSVAKNAIREKNAVLLAEGYMDTITLHKYGFKNSVGVMGVALSETNIQLLSGLTKNFIMCLDSDDAGFNAMERIHNDLLKFGIMPKYIDFSPSKDPDEFLNQNGPMGFQEKINNSRLFIDLIIERLIPKNLPELIDKKLEILHQVFIRLAPVRNDLWINEKLIQVAKALQLKSDPNQIIKNFQLFLQNDLEKKKNRPFVAQTEKIIESVAAEPVVTNETTDDFVAPIDSAKDAVQPLSKVAKILLQEIIAHPESLTHPDIAEILDFVNQNEVKDFINWLKNLYFEIDEAEYTSIIMNHLDDESFSGEIRECVGAALFKYVKHPLDAKLLQKFITDLKKKAMFEVFKKQRDDLKKQQREANTATESEIYLKKLLEVEKELLNLKR